MTTSPEATSDPNQASRQGGYRAFLVLLGLGTVLASVLAWRCHAILGSSDDADAITREFGQAQSLLSGCVPALFLLLLGVQTHAYLRRSASGWIFLLGWLYLALFTGVDYVWLSDAIFQHTRETESWEGGFNAMGIVGLGLSVMGALLSLMNYLIVRGRRRAAPK